MTEVVAALIWGKEGFMICQRPPDKARPLLWEFAGGKVEPGETKPQALVRECREELGVTVAVGEKFAEVTHEYPDEAIHLTLYNCTLAEGTPKLLEHSALKWITPEEIPQYEFCPADTEILGRIAARKTPCEEALPSIKPGIYRHFKGKEYQVLAVARHSETREPMVVYRALYGECGVWVRPASMWSETVSPESGEVARFTYIRDKE